MAKDFSAAISEIMPLVQDGDKNTPFIIYRKQNDDGAEWHVNYPYPAEKSGQAYKELLEADPFAMRYRGADFDGGSFAYVHDKIFCDRLRVEHYDYVVCDEYSSGEQSKMRALMNFFEDNAAAFSAETLAYLAKYDLPFKALNGLCPFNMATGHDGWSFNHDLAPDAVDAIDQRVETLINTRKLTVEESELDEAELNKQTQRDIQAAIESGMFGGSDYDFDSAHIISTIEINGYEIEIGEDTKQAETYYVETSKGGAYMFDMRTDSLAAALEAYGAQIHERADALRKEPDAKVPPMVQPDKANPAPKAKKPDLLGRIAANKQKVEQYKAANKDAPAKKPKRDGQEV